MPLPQQRGQLTPICAKMALRTHSLLLGIRASSSTTSAPSRSVKDDVFARFRGMGVLLPTEQDWLHGVKLRLTLLLYARNVQSLFWS